MRATSRRTRHTGSLVIGACLLAHTDEMLDLARRNQAAARVSNVQWLRGHIEQTRCL